MTTSQHRRDSRETARARIAAQRGAALLDAVHPDWHSVVRIDSDHLAIASPDDCVLGQLYGDFSGGLDELATLVGVEPSLAAFRQFATAHGFNRGLTAADRVRPHFLALDAAWRAEIAGRRAARRRRVRDRLAGRPVTYESTMTYSFVASPRDAA